MMQFVADGIIFAAIISLGAIGLSMIYNILRFANFAQGEIVAAGAYFSLAFVALFGAGIGSLGPLAFGWPLLVSIGFAMVATSLVVLVVDWLLVPPTSDQRRLSYYLDHGGVRRIANGPQHHHPDRRR